MDDDIDDDLPPAFAGLSDVRLLTDASLDVRFTLAERQRLVDGALGLISELYVHLPFKRAVRAVDPERRLRLLQLQVTEDVEESQRARQQAVPRSAGLEGLGLDALLRPSRPGSVTTLDPGGLEGFGLDRLLAPVAPRAAESAMSDREFHDEMLDIFASLHDLHTRYICPDPVRRQMAFLPLLIEECWDEDERGRIAHRYIVSKVYGTYFDGLGLRGAEVTHWNGAPIERAVLRRAQASHGANPDAQHARGIEALTCRWLGTSAPPDEDWVRITYRVDGGEPRELRVRWRVGQIARPDGEEGDDEGSGFSPRIGLDPQSEMRRRWKYALFASASASASAASPKAAASDTPRFDIIRAPSGELGYLRIHTFAVKDVDGFIDGIRDGLSRMPRRGLVIDIRGNPGGDILASERLLALLSTNRGDPQLLQFRVTPMARRIAESLGSQGGPRSRFVIDSIKSGLRSGASYSGGSEIARIEAGDAAGYDGPIVLIVDALCYSAAEVFAAGFQDGRLGRILGTAARTGGGAGNSWGYEALQIFGGNQRFPALPGAPRPRPAAARPPATGTTGTAKPRQPPPPRSASFVVAIRRLTRAGSNLGETFEEVGVQPDRAPYRMTTSDVLGRNEGLRLAAARLIDA